MEEWKSQAVTFNVAEKEDHQSRMSDASSSAPPSPNRSQWYVMLVP